MRRLRKVCVSVVITALLLNATYAAAAEFYVSTEGNDAWTGRVDSPNLAMTDGPFATVTRARDAVRELKQNGQTQDLTVFIRGGRYALKQTIVFGLADSAGPGYTITYAAYPGETPVFSSGVRIEGWKELGRSLPKGLPEMAKNKVWVADVPVDLGRFKTLYDGGDRLQRARTEGFDPKSAESDRYSAFLFPEGRLRSWDNIEDVELVCIPAPWTMQILPLASVDEENLVARTSVKGIYGLGGMRKKGRGNTAWIENVLEALDGPGLWVLNSKEKRLYLWPTGDEPSGQIYAPCLTELIRVEGKIEIEGPTDAPVRGLVFKGLTFTQADRGLVTDEDTSIQHDWEMLDKADALLRLRGAEDCVVEGCRFFNSGGSAVRLDLHCKRNRVYGNEITNLGGGGVLMIGYGPGTKDVNKQNVVVNNHIHHCGEIYWHAHAIVAWQSGQNRIAHNLVHHMPRKAICLSGVRPQFFRPDSHVMREGLRECAPTIRWFEIKNADEVHASAVELGRKHSASVFESMEWPEITAYLHTVDNVVEYNEAYRTNELLADGSCMNVSGAGEGNIIRRNYIHDIYNRNIHGAIRTDDYQNGTLIEENVIFRTNSDGLCLRHNNTAINNVVVDIAPPYLWIGHNPLDGSVIEKNIYFHPGPAQMFIGRGYGPDIWENLRLKRGGSIEKNIYFNTEHPGDSAVLTKMNSLGHEENGAYVDPLFVDWENGDFRLNPDSPALKMGIKSIDVRKAGLTDAFPQQFLTN